MMYQILTIARRDLYTTFTDRNLILIMIATPLLLSTIIGLAFGGGGSREIKLAIVNFDQGTMQQGEMLNLGEQFVSIFQNIGDESTSISAGIDNSLTCPLNTEDDNNPDTTQDEIFSLNMNVTELDNADTARQAVERGEYAAALIIPENFSEQMIPQFGITNILSGNLFESQQAELELYGNSGDAITAGIINSILEGITNRMIAGNIIVQSTIETLIANPDRFSALQETSMEDFDAFACAFDGSITSIRLDQQPLNEVQEASAFVQIVVTIGSAQATFFALFTASASILYIYEEKKQGTFDRLVVAPIPRWYVLAGTLLGTIITIIFQMMLLMIGLIAIASIVEGQLTLIWGTNVFHLALVILGLALSVSGVGVLIAGLANNAQQAQIFSPIVNILLAFFGGAFGIQLPQAIQQFSLIYWGSDAFDKLSIGNTDIGLNVIILMILGLITFSIGTWLFSRRIEI